MKTPSKIFEKSEKSENLHVDMGRKGELAEPSGLRVILWSATYFFAEKFADFFSSDFFSETFPMKFWSNFFSMIFK